MSKILGKVLDGNLDEPRGPDVEHRIRVPASWFERGATIEFEVPRNLSCAECSGGGCDACQRAGAITLREREEPSEIVQVTLPEAPAALAGRAQDIVLRIPGRGGLPAPGRDVPRGIMMLRVSSGDSADDKVWLSEESLVLNDESKKNASPLVVARSLMIGVVLVLLSLVMLRLWGWL